MIARQDHFCLQQREKGRREKNDCYQQQAYAIPITFTTALSRGSFRARWEHLPVVGTTSAPRRKRDSTPLSRQYRYSSICVGSARPFISLSGSICSPPSRLNGELLLSLSIHIASIVSPFPLTVYSFPLSLYYSLSSSPSSHFTVLRFSFFALFSPLCYIFSN